MSVEKYRCNVDKKANKVSSIPRSILLYESIVDIDIDTSKVSIFDINNPEGAYTLKKTDFYRFFLKTQ